MRANGQSANPCAPKINQPIAEFALLPHALAPGAVCACHVRRQQGARTPQLHVYGGCRTRLCMLRLTALRASAPALRHAGIQVRHRAATRCQQLWRSSRPRAARQRSASTLGAPHRLAAVTQVSARVRDADPEDAFGVVARMLQGWQQAVPAERCVPSGGGGGSGGALRPIAHAGMRLWHVSGARSQHCQGPRTPQPYLRWRLAQARPARRRICRCLSRSIFRLTSAGR